MTTTPTRAECQAKAEAAVTKWADALGVSGPWRISTRLSVPEKDDLLVDAVAAVEITAVPRRATVLFHERLKPEFYELEASHEGLHILLAPLQRAIDLLTEPAKSLMDDELHNAVHRIASLLASTATGQTKLGELPPWETT